ncbi:hypothetical protein [Streptomyces sp. AK08-02]|uniref:hypothetical protein n=1 Tax=Streptomyces sp. AK08-02 TaxID=3028654 RepID=UPI0029AF1A96|nr:hypothetical protein [Streptomyces sp. AK08-02]MDX3745617.1 hypothetical protein [Streptomyces sp. AK08-02]
MGDWIGLFSVWGVFYAVYKSTEWHELRRDRRITAEAVERHLVAERQPEDAGPGGEPVLGTTSLALIAHGEGWALSTLVVDMLLHRVLQPSKAAGPGRLQVRLPRSRGQAVFDRALAERSAAWSREQRIIVDACGGSNSPLRLSGVTVMGALRAELVAEGYIRPPDAMTVEVEYPASRTTIAGSVVCLLLTGLHVVWWDPDNSDLMPWVVLGILVSGFWTLAMVVEGSTSFTRGAELPSATARGERVVAEARAHWAAVDPAGRSEPYSPDEAVRAMAVFGQGALDHVTRFDSTVKGLFEEQKAYDDRRHAEYLSRRWGERPDS